MVIKTDKLIPRTNKKLTCPSNSNFESGLHYFSYSFKKYIKNLQVEWDSRKEHKCLKGGQYEFDPWQLFSNVFGEIAGWACKKQVISPRVAASRKQTSTKIWPGIFTNCHISQRHFYHLAFSPMSFLPSVIFTTGIFTIWHIYQWHFYHLAYLPMTFLPSGIFTNGIFTIWHFYYWHFYYWHFYHLAYLPMAFLPSVNLPMTFLPSRIFTNGIFTIWHIYQWHFYHLAYLPMAFLPSGIFTNGIFSIWHFYQWHFYLWQYTYGIFTNGIFIAHH